MEVNPGDTVVYCRQDYVHRVDEFTAQVLAVNEDGSVDLSVAYIAGPINVKGVRFDETGKPSTWHIPPQGWQPSRVTGGITASTGFGSEDVSMGGLKT